jgi:hypothetical protein
MGDHGESLGATMEAAMKGSDAESKKLTVMATQMLADVVRPHVSRTSSGDLEITDPSSLDELSGIRDNMGRILAEHSDDMTSSYYDKNPRLPDNELVGNVYGENTARFNPADLDLALLEVAADEKGYRAALLGQIAHIRGKIDRALAVGNESWLTNVIMNDTTTLGHLVEARRMALVSRGQEADAADEALGKLVQDGIGLVPIPFAQQVGKVGIKVADSIYESFVRNGYAKAGEWLVQQSGHAGGKTGKAFGEAASNEMAVQQMLKQMIESSAVAHEAYHRNNLTGPFVIGDPPRVKPPVGMNRGEYESFSRWMVENSTVPADFRNAQQAVTAGIDEFRLNVKPQDESDE